MRQRKLFIIFKRKLNKGIRSVKQGIAARGVRPVQYAVAALIHYYVLRHECAMARGLTAGQRIKRRAKGYALLLILYAFAYGVFQLIGKAGEKRCVCRGNGALYLNKLRHIVTDFSRYGFHKLA